MCSSDLTKKQAKAALEKLVEIAIAQTKKAGVFVIPGIGRLKKVERKARMGRNPATGALLTTGSFTLGRFAPPASTRFIVPPATRWGRAGLWIDRPTRGDIWLRGYILHVPLAPNGFFWHAWAVQDSLGILKSVAPLGPIADSLGNPIQDHETAPPGTDLPEFPKVFVDATRSRLGVPLERFTHLYVTLEPRGAAPGPSPAVVYRGTFPRQFLLRPKPE